MGKVDHLRKRVEPFFALFWALKNVLNVCSFQKLTLPTCSASLHRCPQSTYLVIIGLVLNEDVPTLPPPLISYLGMLFIYDLEVLPVKRSVSRNLLRKFVFPLNCQISRSKSKSQQVVSQSPSF